MSECRECGGSTVVCEDTAEMMVCEDCGTFYGFDGEMKGTCVKDNKCDVDQKGCLPERGTLTCVLCKDQFCIVCVEKYDIFDKCKSKDGYLTGVCKFCNKKYLK